MRLIWARVVLFLLPFAGYLGFYLLTRRVPARMLMIWMTLTIAGLVLVAGSFVYAGFADGDTPHGRYVPAHVVNGTIVPGHVEKLP
ncbi:MAG: DUF6111 family protein [Rhizomicrobium sp.]|jgi:CHASE2 domain-containing sensor protein